MSDMYIDTRKWGWCMCALQNIFMAKGLQLHHNILHMPSSNGIRKETTWELKALFQVAPHSTFSRALLHTKSRCLESLGEENNVGASTPTTSTNASKFPKVHLLKNLYPQLDNMTKDNKNQFLLLVVDNNTCIQGDR